MTVPRTIHFAGRPTQALERIAHHADMWGGAWDAFDDTSGKLGLPVSAGLRRGWVEGDVRIERDPEGGCRVTFVEDHAAYRVDRASVMILVTAALGCLVSLVAMFLPKLLPLLPIGILLAVGAYLVVIARLRNSGPEEFFETVADDI